MNVRYKFENRIKALGMIDREEMLYSIKVSVLVGMFTFVPLFVCAL